MDKVKDILAVLRKYHFWVLSGLVVIVALGVYVVASGSLADQYQTGVDRIEGKVQAVQNIGSQGPISSPQEIEAGKKQVEARKIDTWEAWKGQYENQQKENPWPQELGEVFLKTINSLPPDGVIPPRYRELYANFVDAHFQTLFDIIDIRQIVLLDINKNEIAKVFDWVTAGNVGAWMEYPPDAFFQEERGTVAWENPEVLSLGTNWISRPTTNQVRRAQEDLWVYEALLRIIRDTNEGATSYYNAPIKGIEALNIGAAASAAFYESQERVLGGIGSGGTMADFGGGGGYDDDDDDDDDYGGSGSYYDATGLGVDEAELQGRYVGANREPLAHDAEHPYAEFKMMPVRMIFYMDQRRIPDLLANCANSSMPVEVIRVSLEPGEGSVLDLAGMIAAAGISTSTASSGSGDYDDDDDDDDSGDDYEGGSAPRSQEGGIVKEGATDMTVEIQGIIHIFNPPDLAKLGTGTAGEETDGSAPGLTPISTPTVSTPGESPAQPAGGPAASPEAESGTGP